MYYIDQKRIVWKKTENEVVILNLNTGHYYTLKEAGLLIWDGVVEQKSIKEIARQLETNYEIDYQSALRDTQQCLENLLTEQIMTLVAETTKMD